ncbi:hypothetical protein KKA50_00285 [Patescibacteria group bacterium]|nr:hypothetical protein [Patescibacteria group bacterium]
MASLLDLIMAIKIKKASFICEEDLNKEMQNVADLLPKGEAFTYGEHIYVPSETARQLLSFNKLYARCLISRIKEIQQKQTEEEIELSKELFSLLPSKISLIIINNQKYHNFGKKPGEILTEEEILSHIMDD